MPRYRSTVVARDPQTGVSAQEQSKPIHFDNLGYAIIRMGNALEAVDKNRLVEQVTMELVEDDEDA